MSERDINLFAGAGGLARGIGWAGFSSDLMYEADSNASNGERSRAGSGCSRLACHANHSASPAATGLTRTVEICFQSYFARYGLYARKPSWWRTFRAS